MLSSFFHKHPRIGYWGSIIISGIMGGSVGTGYSTNYLQLFAYLPLFVLLDQIFQNNDITWKQKFKRSFFICWIIGVIMASIGAHFIVNTAYVYGNMPWVAGVILASFGYGFEITLVLWCCFVFPLFFVKRWNGWDIPFRLFFALVIDLYYPRFFQWSFGGFAFTQVPWIAQVADLIGSWGLGIYTIGFNLLLLLFFRSKFAKGRFNVLIAKRLCMGYILLLLLGLSYGGWRTAQIRDSLFEGKPLQITSIQPNFSLQRLASNPDLAISTRERNIEALFQDSQEALSTVPVDQSIPRLVVWPESVYPNLFFKEEGRRPVQNFAREHETSILLNSVDYKKTPTSVQWYGSSALVGSDGKINGRYDKISLIPFGEYIPGASIFPAFRQWLRIMIPNMSEFEAGKDYTVFNMDNLQISGSICYDVFSPIIIRNMVRNGADLVINLSNLAWFGTSNATDLMELAIRWKAIENRVPILSASNNGESMFINALGEKVGPSLGLFEEGSITETIRLHTRFSFYRDYTIWVHLGFVGMLLLSIAITYFRGRVFSENHNDS